MHRLRRLIPGPETQYMNDIHALRERAKELRCMYAIDSVVSDRGRAPGSTFMRVLEEIPQGWQRPESTGARIEYLGHGYSGPGFASDGQIISESILLWGTKVGKIEVSDRSEPRQSFLPEEVELLRRIASRLGDYLEWKHTELLAERTAPSAMHWTWRQRYVEALADKIDTERFGVLRAYVGGSIARGDAGSGSDIDLYIQLHGSEEQKKEFLAWIQGWSLCLAEVALQQTGVAFSNGILNVKWLEGEPGVLQRFELQELTLQKHA